MKKTNKIMKAQEHLVLKDYFIAKTTIETLEIIGVRKKILKFISKNFDFEILESCSEYGSNLYKLNLLEFFNQEKCFLCFIKLDVNEYIERTLICKDELKQVA
jgi:hypothetical protein